MGLIKDDQVPRRRLQESPHADWTFQRVNAGDEPIVFGESVALAIRDIPFGAEGTIDDLVSVRVPALQSSGVDTEFHPWSNHELQVAVARGAKHNLGEVRLGENAQASRILQDWSGMNDNQVRLFQLRVLIHELFHALDFGDVVRLTAGDHGHAIVMQSRELGFSSNRAGYSRNEIDTDLRTALALERNGLMFAELRRSLDEYRLYWQAQGPMAEQAFASALARLNRTRYP